MKKVTLSVMFSIFAFMLVGCGSDSGNAPSTIVETEEMVWKYAIGDKVLHKSGVYGVVIDMDFCDLSRHGFGEYATGENQWVRKKMQCYHIRIPSAENGLTKEWVSVLELEDATDE